MAENSNRLNDHSFPAAPAYQGAVARGNSMTAMAGDGESASRLSWRDPEQPTVANSPSRGANPGGRARLKAWRRRLVQELKAKAHSQRGMRRRGWWSLPNSCDWGRAGIIDSIIPPSYQHFPAAAGRTAPQGLTLRGKLVFYEEVLSQGLPSKQWVVGSNPAGRAIYQAVQLHRIRSRSFAFCGAIC